MALPKSGLLSRKKSEQNRVSGKVVYISVLLATKKLAGAAVTPEQRLKNINQILAKGLLRLIAQASYEGTQSQKHNINKRPHKSNGVKH